MQVSAAVTEDGVYLLIAELEKALEEPGMRRPAAEAITHYCRNSRIKFEEHWDSLLGVSWVLAAHRLCPPVVSCSAALLLSGALLAAQPVQVRPALQQPPRRLAPALGLPGLFCCMSVAVARWLAPAIAFQHQPSAAECTACALSVLYRWFRELM